MLLYQSERVNGYFMLAALRGQEKDLFAGPKRIL
jgi:hypothetical protein